MLSLELIGSDHVHRQCACAGEEAKTVIVDQTETNLVALRRTIYLTIQSSLDFEECAHKLLKLQLKPGQEVCTGWCNHAVRCV